MSQSQPPARKRSPMRALWRLALFPLGLCAHLFILFEEWVWRRVSHAMAVLARAPAIERFERWLRSAPPLVAALAFLLPGAVLFPFKLAGLYLIAHAHPLMGVAVFALAKIVGAALLARVWTVCEPALRRIGWLSRSIDWILSKKNALKAWLRSTWGARMAKALMARARVRAKSFQRRLGEKAWARAMRRARSELDRH